MLSLHFTSLLLPVEDGHGVLDLLLLFAGFSHLTLQLLLSIELPELGINLLLKHLVLDGAAFVNQLLLTLNGSSVVVKLGVLLAKSVVGGFEAHVLTAGNLFVAFLLTLRLEGLEALEHLLTDLLGRFQVVVEFLFVDAVLGGKELRQAGLSLLKVSGLSAAHVVDAVLDDVFLDQCAGFALPGSFVSQVAVTLDVIHHVLVFLRNSFSLKKQGLLTNSCSRRAMMWASERNFCWVYSRQAEKG